MNKNYNKMVQDHHNLIMNNYISKSNKKFHKNFMKIYLFLCVQFFCVLCFLCFVFFVFLYYVMQFCYFSIFPNNYLDIICMFCLLIKQLQIGHFNIVIPQEIFSVGRWVNFNHLVKINVQNRAFLAVKQVH